VGHVARTEEIRKAYQILVSKSKMKAPKSVIKYARPTSRVTWFKGEKKTTFKGPVPVLRVLMSLELTDGASTNHR
jgi:hypothetical protein